MTWSGRSILAAGVALGLSACNFLEGMDLSFSRVGCAVFPETKVGAVNWDTARTVNMRIRQGEYRPMVLGFTAERTYVLRIANADNSDRMFRASGFFDSIAVGLVRVGNRDYETTCLSAVTIGPRETAEIWFVAKRDGRYEFEDQLVPYLFSQGASGVIHVSYARPRHISPVSHLIVPEGVPTAPFLAPNRQGYQGNQATPKAAPQQSPPPMEIPAAPLSSSPQAPNEPPAPVAAPRPAVSPAPFELPAAPLTPVTPEKSKAAPKASKVSLTVDGKIDGSLQGFWNSLFQN
jgi:hypothetical protein